MTDHPREFELKLAVEPAALEELAASGLLSEGGAMRSRRLRSVYYDTPDLRLNGAGLTLRLRHGEDGTVQTVKRGAASVDRGEWEAPCAGAGPDAEAAAATPIGALSHSRALIAGLEPLFSVEVERRSALVLREGSSIEVSLDHGRVLAGEHETGVCEVELELKQGDPDSLFVLARELGGPVGARLSLESKSARGYRLLRGEEDALVTVPAFGIERGMCVGEAARAVGEAAAGALLHNVARFVAAPGVGPLHQSRVAMRRLRAHWTLFADVFETGDEDRLADELRWLSGLMGEARDLDVFIGEVLPRVEASHPDAPGFTALRGVIEARRDASYGRLKAVLQGARCFALTLETLRRIERAARPGAGRKAAKPAETYLNKVLARRLDKVLARSADLAALSADERHGVRIKAKKLRYMMEPFAQPFGSAGLAERMKRLKAIQKSLGLLNDAKASADLMCMLFEDGSLAGQPAAAFAAGLVAGAQRQDPGLLDKAQEARDALAKDKGRAL